MFLTWFSRIFWVNSYNFIGENVILNFNIQFRLFLTNNFNKKNVVFLDRDMLLDV